MKKVAKRARLEFLLQCKHYKGTDNLVWDYLIYTLYDDTENKSTKKK